MKVIVDAKANEVATLAKLGLLKGARILERKEPKRRQLSQATEAELVKKLDELRLFRLEHGSFDIPRTGEHSELGEWLDKLKETYVKRPNGYRIRWLREHAKDVLKYLSDWSAAKVTKAGVRNVPFWLSAAWVCEFMSRKLAAPSQASIHPDEVALAKWLTRWTGTAAMQGLASKAHMSFIASTLDDVARDLRSRNAAVVDQAREVVRHWQAGPLYTSVAALCETDAEWMTGQRRRRCERQVLEREAFWPTWTEWRRDAEVWVRKPQRPNGKA